MEAPTVAEAMREAVARLRAAGVASPEVDVRLLLARVLGRRPLALVLDPGLRLTPAESAEIARLVGERAARRPLQHLLEDVEFYGRAFAVAPGVLVPRPETEAVVEAALAALPRRPAAPLRAGDIGSGAGVIGLTLAAERPDVEVTCIDRDPAAALLTVRNAVRLGVAARVHVVRADLVAPLAAGALDLLVSNPPYVPSGVIATLAPEVRDHDPRLALDGGPDGIEVIARLLAGAGRVLRPGGGLVVEIGDEQGEGVRRLAAAQGFADVTIRPDLAGRERVLCARRAE